MKRAAFNTFILICLICQSCAAVPDLIKSHEQIKIDRAEKKLEDNKKDCGTKTKQLEAKLQVVNALMPKTDSPVTEAVAEYRRLLLDDRQCYVQTLLDEHAKNEAILEKKMKNASYLALGTKSIAICSGIASAVLVAASPANAVYVAGLGAVSSGTAAFQETAEGVGISSAIAEEQLEVMKDDVKTAFLKFTAVPWDYLYSFAGYANRSEWDDQMKKLGGVIVELEAAVRFTSYEVKVTARTKKAGDSPEPNPAPEAAAKP